MADPVGDIIGDYRKIQLEGTKGAVRGDLGLYRGYPEPLSDIIDANGYDDAGWELLTDTDARWIPDAFAGPMLELMRAIEAGDEPATSGRDNLNTLRVVEAMYESDATGQRVELTDLAG